MMFNGFFDLPEAVQAPGLWLRPYAQVSGS